MEIDVGNTGSSSNSRHASPFHHTIISSTSTSSNDLLSNAGPSGSVRKRRRSIRSPFYSDAIDDSESHSGMNYVRDFSEDEDSPRSRGKRRNLSEALGKDSGSTSHFFNALGSRMADIDAETGETMSDIRFQEAGGGSMYEASEYGVDSPMNLLRLISRSPSIEDCLQIESNEMVDEEDIGDDIEMSVGGSDGLSSIAIERLKNVRQSSSTPIFVPRQLRNTQLRSATMPVRPSPLAQQSDDFGSTASSDSSPRPKMMERSNSNTSQESTFSLRRSLTHSSIQRTSTILTTETNLYRRMSHDDQGNVPLRRSSRSDRIIRTPSPMPQMVNIESDNQNENQNSSSSTSAIRPLHPSPGMNSSPFPGGKQMLRYTMGYRDDCEQCKNKVPGHYGHVVHRTA